MPLNIPNTDLPGTSFLKGLNTGSTMFSRIMQPILEREKQKQLSEQFGQQLGFKKSESERLENHFLKELALKKQQEARLGANSDLNRQLLEQQILNYKNKNDPQKAMKELQYKLDYINDLEKQFGQNDSNGQNIGGQQQQQPVSFMDILNKGQNKEIPQGQGIFPQEEPQQQQSIGINKNPYGVDMKYIRQGMIYKALGLPVPKQLGQGTTPQEREKIYDLRERELAAKIKHNEALEKNASAENRITLAKELADIKGEQKKQEFNDRASSQYKSKLNAKEGEMVSKMEDEAIQGIKSQPIMDELSNLVSNPTFEEMRKHPYLGHIEMGYYKKSGNQEQQSLAHNFDLITKKLIADTAKGLNTRFTDKDLALAQGMKINDSDTLEGAKAKAESLIYLHKLGQTRLDTALNIAKQEQISPYEAIKRADEALDADKIRSAIHTNIYGNSTNQEKVWVISPKGKRIQIPKSELDAALKAGGHRG